MLKKLSVWLCALTLLIGAFCICAAATDTDTVATIGEQEFTSVESAIAAVDAEEPETTVVVLQKPAGDLTFDKTVYLDLNGQDVNSVSVAEGLTLYCLDSETDDYLVEGSAEDGYTGFGRIEAIAEDSEGTVAGVAAGIVPTEDTTNYPYGLLDGYLMVEEGTGLSFHRVNLQITAMTLRSQVEGEEEINPSLYYKSAFAADALVKDHVASFGIALSVTEEPNATNMGVTNRYSSFSADKFVAGVDNSEANSTLLYGVMKETNGRLTNQANASKPIFGRAYIKLTNNQYIFGTGRSRSLQTQTELISNEYWSDQSDENILDLIEMYDTYRAVMQKWSVENIAQEPRNKVRILGIGNSYTQDSMRMLAEVYKAEGSEKKLTLGIAYYGGCTLSQHSQFITEHSAVYSYYYLNENGTWTTEKNVTLEYILKQENWDLVSMQQGSASSGRISTYDDSYIYTIRNFVNKTLGYAPTYMWNMTWAWPVEDCDDDGDTALTSSTTYNNYYSGDQLTMYKMILDCVQQKIDTDPKFEYLMPVGTAIQNAKTSFLGDKDLHRDDSHLNDLGRLFAAYVWYCTLENETLDEIKLTTVPEVLTYSYKGGNMAISESVAEVVAESVNNAIEHPFEVTQSECTNDYSTRKILAIGNSYSSDSMRMLKAIYDAEGSGKNVVLGIAYNAGCSLSEHVGYIEADSPDYTYYYMVNGVWKTKSEVTLEYILQQEDWQYVSLQQASTYSGIIDTYNDEDIATIKECVETNLGYKPVYMWNMTWAYPEVYINSNGETVTNSTKAFVESYGSKQETMYSMIVDCVRQKIATNPEFEYLMPVGTAIQNAHTSFLGDLDLYRDNLHLNDLGRVFAGYVWYCTLENETLDEIKLTTVPEALTYSYKEGDMVISEEVAKVIVESVNNAISNKFAVTQSQFTEAQ